ncbi:Biopolymer transport protein ExbB [subsurface metagenome]
MEWGLVEMWGLMAPLAKGVAIVLMILSVISLYLFIERQLVFYKARAKSKKVAPQLAGMLKRGQIQEALKLSSTKENQGSHLARVTAAGIKEFLEGKQYNLSFEEQIETAQRGCARAATIFTQELSRGSNTIATIATSSPFIGLFGTIAGIMNAFRGMAQTGSGGIGAVAGGIAEALVTTAFGIGVAILALWLYSFLRTRIDIYSAEMTNTSSEIVDFFIRRAQEKPE